MNPLSDEALEGIALEIVGYASQTVPAERWDWLQNRILKSLKQVREEAAKIALDEGFDHDKGYCCGFKIAAAIRGIK